MTLVRKADYKPQVMKMRDRALKFHLENPLMTASELVSRLSLTQMEVKNLYRKVVLSEGIQAYINSPFYQWRIASRFAANIIKDLSGDTSYWNKLMRHEPVMSRTLELHPTLGTCEYRCAMCLWSGGDKRFIKGDATGSQPLKAKEWSKILEAAYRMGTKRVLLSGGGEPLLNPDLFKVIESARRLGMKVSLYTNGFRMDRLNSYEWQQVMKLGWIRFSVHSPVPKTYANIVGMPYKREPLDCIANNIKKLLFRREKKRIGVQVGMAFVIQSQNYNQIRKMAEFAASLGVDFLDIRQDSVNISKPLSFKQWATVVAQLRTVRQRAIKGNYGITQISIADSLTAIINGKLIEPPRAKECFSKIYRPVISPFGVMTPCDLKAEPKFFNADYVLGRPAVESLDLVVKRFQSRKIRPNCEECMPSGRVGNAICHKIFEDYKDGILPNEQPFVLLYESKP